jgi:hypothetical protein
MGLLVHVDHIEVIANWRIEMSTYNHYPSISHC